MSHQHFSEYMVMYLRDQIDPDHNILAGLALSVSWHDSVSNSHDCPHNGVTNWGGRKDGEPRGYPGWSGRIWLRYYPGYCKCGWGSDPAREVGVYTGTGGFGSHRGPWQEVVEAWEKLHRYKMVPDWLRPQCYGYDVRIFADDFPELLREYRLELAQMIMGCSDYYANNVLFTHEYTDADTLFQDDVLIRQAMLEDARTLT